MYDLVKIIVPIDDNTIIDFDREIELVDSYTGVWLKTRGLLKNLRVEQKQNNLIIEGS